MVSQCRFGKLSCSCSILLFQQYKPLKYYSLLSTKNYHWHSINKSDCVSIYEKASSEWSEFLSNRISGKFRTSAGRDASKNAAGHNNNASRTKKSRKRF